MSCLLRLFPNSPDSQSHRLRLYVTFWVVFYLEALLPRRLVMPLEWCLSISAPGAQMVVAPKVSLLSRWIDAIRIDSDKASISLMYLTENDFIT